MGKTSIKIKRQDLPKQRNAFAQEARARQHIAGGGHRSEAWYNRRNEGDEIQAHLESFDASGKSKNIERVLSEIHEWLDDDTIRIYDKESAFAFLKNEMNDPFYTEGSSPGSAHTLELLQSWYDLLSSDND